MKIEVITAFRDKETGELNEVGKEVEVSDERGKSLIGRGFAVKAGTSKEKAEKSEADKEKKSISGDHKEKAEK